MDKKVIYFSFIIISILVGSCNSSEDRQEDEVAVIENSDEDSVIGLNQLPEEEAEAFITDWEKFNLIGEVVYISDHSYEVDDEGEQIGMGGAYVSYGFDSTGRISDKETSGCCGAYFRTIFYKYNDQNQLTHRIIYATDDWSEDITKDADYSSKEKYFYKEDELVKVKIAGFDQVLTQEKEFEYENEELVLEVITFVHEEETETIKYEYSPTKYVETHFKSDSIFDYKIEHDLDENGNIIEARMYLDDGKIQQERFTYKYDEKGNWIEQTSKYHYILEDGSEEEWRNGNTTERSIKYYSE